jgi:putative tryptophan/tyrosine transport system substrate-binding protein
VRRRFLWSACVFSLASGIGVLGVSIARAVEAARTVARIGFISPSSPSSSFNRRRLPAFWDHLRELGWVRGENLAVEERWAEGRYDRLPTLMQEVLGRKVDVLVTYTTPAGIAAKNATSTIPIVDALMGDPVGMGLAASLAHPGGNLTGLSMGWTEGIAGKWLELLQETVPRLSTVAVIADPNWPISREQVKRLEAVAPKRAIKIRIIAVRGPEDLERAFARAGRTAQAVLVLSDQYLDAQPQRVLALAARYRLPDMHVARDYVDAGGLMAYAPDMTAMFQRAADYVDRILRGAKPADLPIEEPTKFELVVNLKTAKVLGLTIPESILLRADEVIR